MAPLVFVDTNVFKFTATSLPRYVARQQRIQWGPLAIDVTVHDDTVVNPNERIQNSELKTEADLLFPLAELGKAGTVRYIWTVESLCELWGLPNLDSQTEAFYGAPVAMADAPFYYQRAVGGIGIDSAAERMRFLLSINSKRFFELQKATGAYQGELPPNKNQMLDAFHMWCAEHNRCDYFLTLDFSLIRVLGRSPLRTSVRVVKPSELLRELSGS